MGLFQEIKRKKKTFNRVKKEKAPTGYSTDDEVIKAFGLSPGKGVTVKTQLRKIEEGKFEDQITLKFVFVVQEGKSKGMPLDETIWFDPSDAEKFTNSVKSFMFILQKLGYDTSDLSEDDLEQLTEELTEEKPYCKVYVSCYKQKKGKGKGTIRIGLRVNSPYDPEDEDESDNESSPEDEEDLSEEDDEVPFEEEDESEEETTDSAESDAEDDSDEDVEDDDDSEEEADGPDEDDPATWVGYSVTCRPPKTRKTAIYEVVKHIKRGNRLVVKSKYGSGRKEYQISPDDVKDWA